MDLTAGPKTTDEWGSPQTIVDLCALRYGPFDMDAAADADNAKAPIWITRLDDGLQVPWQGRVWLNPPWCRTKGLSIVPWIDRAIEQAQSPAVSLVCLLVPASSSTRWWHKLATHATLIRLIKGRQKYGDGGSAKFPSCVVILTAAGGPARIETWDPKAEIQGAK